MGTSFRRSVVLLMHHGRRWQFKGLMADEQEQNCTCESFRSTSCYAINFRIREIVYELFENGGNIMVRSWIFTTLLINFKLMPFYINWLRHWVHRDVFHSTINWCNIIYIILMICVLTMPNNCANFKHFVLFFMEIKQFYIQSLSQIRYEFINTYCMRIYVSASS